MLEEFLEALLTLSLVAIFLIALAGVLG